MSKRAAYDRLSDVRGELDSAQFALSYTIRHVDTRLDALQEAGRGGISQSELVRCRNKLEINYILRLFSEFEASVRSYWASEVRRTRPTMKILMDRVADRLRMSPSHLAAAHAIREYRNDVIHQNPGSLAHTFGECARALGIYLNWLPQNW